MSGPRFHIGWVMVVIAVAALDFAAMRALSDSWGRTSGLLGLGVLPMANILAAALLLGRRHRGRRRFLVGFELFGGAALMFYVGMILSGTNLPWTYFLPVIVVLQGMIGPITTTPGMLIYLLSLGIWATGPQLAFALIGGFLAASRSGEGPRDLAGQRRQEVDADQRAEGPGGVGVEGRE